MIRRHFLALMAAPAFPSTDPAAVLEMVGVAHRDPSRVRTLVERHPGLARAAIDWGFGDWETALGAASHVGNREIAEYLLAHGETPTIFSAAMLGQVDLVKGLIAGSPGIERSYGPHGITLLAHARAGGAKAAPVVQYLTELGHADVPLPTQPLAATDRDAILGKYAFGAGSDEYYVIDLVKDQLGINRPGAPARRFLYHSGDLEFFPSGAPWAKITFARVESTVASFTLSGIGAPVTARRS
jgi:hypothetical protein